MSEEKEVVKEMSLAKNLQPTFGKLMDELIKTIPEDKLYTPFTCYTIKHMLMDHIVFGSTTFNSHAWYNEEKKKLEILVENSIPPICEYYHQHGMGHILVIENGEWRIYLCTLQNNLKKEFLEYHYMKEMGQPEILATAYHNWLEWFEAEREKEREAEKAKWEAEHPKVEELVKVEEPVNESFFKGIFNKIFKGVKK